MAAPIVQRDRDRPCPTCGARLVTEHHVNGEAIRLWQCAKQHWWMQSTVLGWVAIDPGGMAVEAPTRMTAVDAR